jgi:hypothetical protein
MPLCCFCVIVFIIDINFQWVIVLLASLSSHVVHCISTSSFFQHIASQHPLRMSCSLEPSYESTYQEIHKINFKQLRGLVQTPEPCIFMHKDLTWAIQIRAKRFKDGPKTHAPIFIAYIPWVRVHDYMKGEEARIDGPCKFVCQGTMSNQQGKLTFICWNNYSAVMGCVCNM